MNYRMFSLGAIALALFVVGASALSAKEARLPTHFGKVVSITDKELVMTGRGGTQHTHAISEDATCTLDGKTCHAADIKPGTKIRVTTRAGDAKVAVHIEAIDKNKNFANTHEGKLVSVTVGTLVMKGVDGKEHSHSLSEEVRVTCDEKECKWSDLKAGQKIRVTTSKTNRLEVIEIEALEKDADFT